VAPAAALATVQALERLTSGSIPSRVGIAPAARNRFIHGQVARRLGLQWTRHAEFAARQTAMTSVMTLIPSCGGDMSSPQKRPSTRHDSSTASDNRR
jgi:hypothetical protein